MPVYSETFTIPADTKKENPVTREIKIEQRLITKIEVHFPAGCCGMVGLRIYYGRKASYLKQIWPYHSYEDFIGDNETISFREWWKTPELPCYLTLVGYSPNTKYSHTLVIRFGTLPELVAAPGIIFEKLFRFLKKIL